MEGYLPDAVKIYGSNTAQYLYRSFWTLLDDPREGSCPDGVAQKQWGVCGVLSLECPLRYSTSSIPIATRYCHMSSWIHQGNKTESRAAKNTILDGNVSVKERCLIHLTAAHAGWGLPCDLELCPVAARFAWRGLGNDQDSRDYAVRRPSTSSHQPSTPSPTFLARLAESCSTITGPYSDTEESAAPA